MELKRAKELRKNAASAADMLHVLANAERLMILCQLIGGEMSVGQLREKSSLSQSAFSQHLSILRANNIVSTRKEMQTVFYSITSPKAIQLLESLYRIFC